MMLFAIVVYYIKQEKNGGIVLMRACRPGPFKKWSVLLRITAYYRVLPRIKRSVLPLGTPRTPRFPGKSGVPPGGPRRITIPPFLSGLKNSSPLPLTPRAPWPDHQPRCALPPSPPFLCMLLPALPALNTYAGDKK